MRWLFNKNTTYRTREKEKVFAIGDGIFAQRDGRASLYLLNEDALYHDIIANMWPPFENHLTQRK